ncbi:MAG: hypothetical protein CL949_13700 [Erythrobacter sp.]|nr:hypothetical protein [Erythrobacter sp.]
MEMDLDILLRHQDAEEFDLFRAIADMGVHYSERPLPGSESGRIWRDGSRFTILVNSRLPAGRRRFSAAHQLAHYMFLRDLLPDHGEPHVSQIFEENRELHPKAALHERQERTAKKIAVQIMLPAAPIRRHHANGQNTEHLAALYKTTPAAMTIRLRTLSLQAN